MRRIILIACVCFLSGCNYLHNRWYDAKDCITLSLESGLGCKVRASSLTTGVYVNFKSVGLRGGRFNVFDQPREGWIDFGPELNFLVLADERFSPTGTMQSDERGKSFDSETVFGVPIAWKDNSVGILSPYWTQFEVAATLPFGGVRAGVNPGEMLDFLLGWFGVDIYKDDVVTSAWRGRRLADEVRIAKKADELRRLAQAKANYEEAKGAGKKKWALLLDKLEGVDYTKEFGRYYEGKTFDRELAERTVHLSLYRRMLWFDQFLRNKLMPGSKPVVNERWDYGDVKLGMADEAQVIAAAKIFLAHIGDVLNGRKIEPLHVNAAWAYSEMHRRYNQWLTIDNQTEFEAFSPDILNFDYWRWNLYRMGNYYGGGSSPLLHPDIVKVWADYMKRTHGMGYIRRRVLDDAYRFWVGTRIRRTNDRTLYKELEVKGSEEWMKENQAVVDKQALAYLAEARAVLDGTGKKRLEGIEWVDGFLADFVVWEAMLKAKDFAEYAHLDQLLDLNDWQEGRFPESGYTPKAYPQMKKAFEAVKKVAEKNGSIAPRESWRP